MAQYSIKDLENLSGIKAHTIRIWEKRYGIIDPGRTDTNIRSYSDDDLRHILNIAILNNKGMKISYLASLAQEDIEKKVLEVTSRASGISDKIEALILAMLTLNEDKFHELFNQAVEQFSFEETYIQLILPSLEKIGLLWLSGSITPAQEHFISNLIRQKLIFTIESIPNEKNDTDRKFILFLPEKDLHEMGLLYAYYLLKKRGFTVLYIGSGTPVHSVAEVEKFWKAKHMIISVIMPMNESQWETFIADLHASFPKHQIVLTGSASSKHPLPEKSPIRIIDRLDELEKYIQSLN